MACRYGHQMAVHTAIGSLTATPPFLSVIYSSVTRDVNEILNVFAGLLFLSGGRATLGRSNAAIAALLCALFPVYPMDTMDCRYHLQAFRHLYVLAVEHRCLELYDADTDEAIVAPVHITIKQPSSSGESANSITVEQNSPCLLPPWDLIQHVEVRSPRYWPLKLEKALLNLANRNGDLEVLSFTTLHACQLCSTENMAYFVRLCQNYHPARGVRLYVKKRAAHLGYRIDPKGQMGLRGRLFPTAPDRSLESMHAKPANVTRECRKAFFHARTCFY